jgi:hypothetical protein
MRILKKQHGMATISWILLLGFIITISFLAVKIIPIYYNYYRITSTLENLKSDIFFQISAKNQEKIKTELLNLLGKANLPEVTSDEITVTEADDKYNVRVKHQYKEKILKDRYFILNVDESTYIYR